MLEHMKKINMPISEQVFQSLVYGHAKLGQIESADNVIHTMKEAGLKVDIRTFGAKLVGMLHHGASYDEICKALTGLQQQGIRFEDQVIFDLVTAFAQRGEVEAANSIVEHLPKAPGFFNVMRNNMSNIVFCGQANLALEIFAKLWQRASHEIAGQNKDSGGHGFFIIQPMITSDYPVEEVYAAIQKLNPDRAALEETLMKSLETYFFWKNYNGLSQMLGLFQKNHDETLLVKARAQRGMGQVLKTISNSSEEAIENLIELYKSGFPIRNQLIREKFFPLVLTEGDYQNLTHTFLTLSNDKFSQCKMLPSVIGSALLQENLSKQDPEAFRQSALLVLFIKGPKFSPFSWKMSLASSYLNTMDLDSLKVMLLMQSNLHDMILNPTHTEPLYTTHVFESLLGIYNFAPQSQFSLNETPDAILNKVLQELVASKFGVPEEVTLQLTSLVKSDDIRDNLKILAENYKNFKTLWTAEEMEGMTSALKAKLIKNGPKMPKVAKPYTMASNDNSTGEFNEEVAIRHLDAGTIDKSLADSYLTSLVRQGKFQEAETKLERIRELYPGFKISINLISEVMLGTFKRTGDVQQVIDQCARFKHEYDHSPLDALKEIATDLFKQGREEDGYAFLNSQDLEKAYVNWRRFLAVNLAPYTSDGARLLQSLQIRTLDVQQLGKEIEKCFASGDIKTGLKLRDVGKCSEGGRFDFTPKQIEPLFFAKFKELQDIQQTLDCLTEDLSLQAPAINLRWLLQISLDHLEHGKTDLALKTIELINQHPSVSKLGISRNLVSFFSVNSYKFAEKGLLNPVIDQLTQYHQELSKFKMHTLLYEQDYDAALEFYQDCNKGVKGTPFGLYQLLKTFTANEDKERLQKLLDITIKMIGEHNALFHLARCFLSMERPAQAKKLMNAPGLNYNHGIVLSIVKKLQDRQNSAAIREFAKMCLPLFGSNQVYLFGLLVNESKGNPDQMMETYTLMEEFSFIPIQDLLETMAQVIYNFGGY